MDYKYIVHLSEDLVQHEEAVRKILSFSDEFSGSASERLALCEQHFTFRRFVHPGEAISYYETERIIPDLKIQDIDFTELKNKRNVPEHFRKNTSGILEIQWVLNFIEENRLDKDCFFVPYSGKLDDSLIVEALKETGWLDRVVSKVWDIVSMRTLKDNQPVLKVRIIEAIKKLPTGYFKRLDTGERNRLKATASAGKHADWNNYRVRFETFEFSLKNMLVGYGDTSKMPPEDISRIVSQVLSDSHLIVEFNGANWKSPGVCYKSLIQYLEDVDGYQSRKREITLRSIDIILEFLKIYDEMGLVIDIPIALSQSNHLYKLGTHSKKGDWTRVFRDKLVGRRVAIALSSLYEFTGETIYYVCEFLSKGETGYRISINTKGGVSSIGESPQEKSFISNTITKDLGLFRDNNKVLIEDGKVLPEEMNFVRSYISNNIIVLMRRFLDQISQPLLYLKEYQIDCPDEFLDVASLNKVLYSVQKSAPKQMPAVLNYVNTLLKSNQQYSDLRRILVLSNPIFLSE
jgi:hypothetical protein